MAPLLANVCFRSIADISKSRDTVGVTVIFSKLTALSVVMMLPGCTAEKVPPDRKYSGREFCLDEQRWDAVIAYTQEFGRSRGFSYAGGENQYEGAGLTIVLSKGRSLFRQTAIAFHVRSDFFDRQKARFFAITRERMTPAETSLARQFEAGLERFSCS